MAIKDCDTISNIVAASLIAWDDELSQEIARLSKLKRESLSRSRNLKTEAEIDLVTWQTAHSLELKAASADVELRAITQAKILNWEINVAWAYDELARQIKKTHWTLAWWIELLEKVRNASVADFWEIARLWDETLTPAEAVKDITDKISSSISANYSIRQYSDFVNDWITNVKKQLRAWTITAEQAEKDIANMHDEAMKAIEKWENPSWYAKLDEEWQAIKKIAGKDVEAQKKAWNQYIMARELLADGWVDDEVLKIFKRSTYLSNLTWDLTYDALEKYTYQDLDKLLARAYTNTKQLYEDSSIREAYRQKLVQLTSWMEIDWETEARVKSIINTLNFTEQWATISDVLVREKVFDSAKRRWLDVSWTNWTKLYQWLQTFAEAMSADPAWIPNVIEIGWVKMKPIDVAQLIYDATWDNNIIKLIDIWQFDDNTILDVATQYLLWDNKTAQKKIIALFSKAKDTADITNIRDLEFKAITSNNIKEWAPMAFFDFRKGLYPQDELTRYKADFYDALAGRNKMRIDAWNIPDITDSWTSKEVLEKALWWVRWWYLVVNDVKWKENNILREAVNEMNKWLTEDSERFIHVIFPNRAMSANFVMENWNLYFKTVDDQLYRDVAWTISIQTLWEATPTREIETLAKEAATWTDAAWNKVDELTALEKYNDKINDAAIKYYWELLWFSWKEVDQKYVDAVQSKLSELTWIDVQSFKKIKDKSKLWQKIDKKLSLAKLQAWRYDRELIDAPAEIRRLEWLSDDDLAKSIKADIWDVINVELIKENDDINHIREAYIDYKLAGSAVDSLAAKWKIISLMNGWSAETMSMKEIVDMFKSKNFENIYKAMFFPNEDFTKKEAGKLINEINDSLFDTISVQFAENLIDAWYSLPLVNIKEIIYEYLTDTLDLNSKFASAFFFKNNIPPTADSLKAIVTSFMPKEIKFWYEDALYRWLNFPDWVWEKAVFREVENNFLQDSYSALATIEMVKKWEVPAWYEKKILEDILTKYYNAFSEWFDKWITFADAEKIKQEASYALDMFEQDFLIPRYGRFLTPQEKQSLMGMKYSLPIAVTWQNKKKALDNILEVKERLLKTYDRSLKSAAKNNEINMAVVWKLKTDDAKLNKKIDERKKLLMENWWVIREVWWEYLVYDTRQALKDIIRELPKNIKWVEWIRSLWADWINQLTNKQAYTLLRYLEAAKALNATANYATELMYKQNPMLLKYAFFDTFKVADIWNGTMLPRALHQNALLNNKIVWALDNSAKIDESIKVWIFSDIISQFRKDWYLEMDNLKKIISKNIDANISELIWPLHLSGKEQNKIIKSMNLTYQNAFTPYTYLRDIPSWWELKWWWKLVDVKSRVEETMKQQYDDAVADLRSMGYADMESLQDLISITLTDWETKTLRDLAKVDIDNWKQSIFNDKNVFVEAADIVKAFDVDPAKKLSKRAEDKLIAQQKEFREEIVNSYNSTFQSMMNQTQIISESERKLLSSFMQDVRTDLKKYDLTNMLSDASDALSWLNEEAARWIKDYLIWFKWIVSFWKAWSKQIMDRYNLVKEAYEWYYQLSIDKLAKIKPTSQAEDLALKIAKYFKTLEAQLWSADWLTWCTTKAELNRAFYHIWETFMSLKDVTWVFWMLSAIEQNQILKFFKFASGDLRRQADVFIRKWASTAEWLWWYRDYAVDVSWITREEFNEIFASAFSDEEFKRVIQWLTWFTITWAWWRTAQRILNFLNGSYFISRFFMSYPWQLLTIPQQSIAYFLKQKWFEKDLWIESLSEIDNIRWEYGFLNGAYNEITLWKKSVVNPDDMNPSSYYNRYWIPDIDRIYQNAAMETTDNYLDMYSKIDDYASSDLKSLSRWQRQLDPYKDNANNIIDWLFARNFKNIAFIKALKWNDFIQFGSAKAFKEFMNDPTVSAKVKSRLMSRVQAYSGRNFRNILWLGFWWLDRPVAWSWFGNIMYWLMQMFNFRWSWWQNIFKQTWSNIETMLKMAFTTNWLSKEWKDAIARYVATQPEFMNFIWALYNDVVWTWKLTRFQDNWQWNWEDEYDLLDFLNFFTDTLNMTSQWFQGIQSFWPARPIVEMWKSALNHTTNPTVYKDTFWMWAFFNALGKNFWRQWKPYNWITKAIWAFTTDWWDWAMAFIQNKFWELSFWSLRYMVNEDMNSYWYTYELSWQVWWIPSIVMWEAPLWSDKNFSYEIDNNETWETIQEAFDSDLPWDTRWTYLWNLAKAFVNWSQLAWIPKNLKKALQRRAPSYYTANDLADIMQNTSAGKEFYDKGIVTPQTPEEAKLFFDTILKNSQYRPGSSNFNKSLLQFYQTWHMNGKNVWNDADAEMEYWLNQMRYIVDDSWRSTWKLDPEFDALIKDVETHYYDQTYCTDLIYDYSKQWLNNHQTNPNYQLYVKLLWQWQAHNLIESKEDEIKEYLNAYAWKKADQKWSETEVDTVFYNKMLLNLGNSVLEWDNKTFFDKLQILDTDSSTVAALEIIKNQAKWEDRKILDKFYNVKEGDEWIKSVELKSQYQSILTQIWWMSRALTDWNTERFIAIASSLVHQYWNDDPTWAITASMIDSIYNRIYQAKNISALQKQELMIELFHDNKEFIQKNPDLMRQVMWDDYDLYADYMNQVLYQWDWMAISNLESIQSSWDKSAKWASSKAASLSSAFKKLSLSYGWDNYSKSSSRSSTPYKEWVPVKIQWASLVRELWVNGYTPTNLKTKFKGYNPHLDLSLAKDINRNVKTTKTQTVSSKKQLSDIEKKTTKAIEAES